MEPTFVEGGGGLLLATWNLGPPRAEEAGLERSDGALAEGGTARPTLLVAHATGFHARCYRALAEGLADRFGVVGFDCRAHGHSGTPALVADDEGRVPTMDWGCFAEDALAVVDALGLGHPVGFGHSSGGAALLLAEQRRPGTFGGIYAYEPVVAPPEVWARMGEQGGHPSAAARRRRAVFASRDAAVDHLSTKRAFSSVRSDVLVDYVEGGFADRPDGSIVLRCDPEAEAATYTMATRAGVWDHLAEVGCPVTVATGGDRAEFGAPVATAVAARLPHGRVEEHADLGHLGPFERPDEIAEAVDAAFA